MRLPRIVFHTLWVIGCTFMMWAGIILFQLLLAYMQHPKG